MSYQPNRQMSAAERRSRNDDLRKEYTKEVKRNAAGNWDQILDVLAGNMLGPALGKIGKHVACPIHGGKNHDAFRLFNDVRQTGGGICNTCGSKEDGFSMLQWVNGWTFGETVDEVARVCGVPSPWGSRTAPTKPRITLVPPEPEKSPEEIAREDNYIAAKLAECWDATMDLGEVEAEVGREYLRSRGLHTVAAPLSDIRFHPGLSYWENNTDMGEFPALVCMIRQPNNQPMTIQRIYLAHDGSGKAPVEKPKKQMRRRSTCQYAGSTIRFDQDVGAVLVIAEGPESALSYREMFGFPTWAACDAGQMEVAAIPPSVKILIAAGDLDLPTTEFPEGRGQRAAKTLVDNFRLSGRKGTVSLPPFQLPQGATKGMDWNDVLTMYGVEAAREADFVTQMRDSVYSLLLDMGLEWADARAHY